MTKEEKEKLNAAYGPIGFKVCDRKVCECGWQLPKGFITEIDIARISLEDATVVSNAAFGIHVSLWCPNCDKTHKVPLLDERLFIRLRRFP